MAKQQRVTHSRTVKKKAKQAVKLRATPAPRRARAATPAPKPPPLPPPAPAPPVKKPGYYEAIALYENGVRALQRHDFEAAADHFRTVLDRYPDERELLERARLYLRVCERETARRPAGPQTMQERVYAATVALNSGDHAAALDHLRRALEQSPDSDHAHYIMAVALTMRGAPDDALEHLRQAIALNPENRGLARQDPDLEGLRTHAGFAATLDGSGEASRRRNRAVRR
ncbi:MAG: tetratricopeptide repeat protein [Acidobacteria bacterium]|nr:tetratricopeptide repeat protein [Acidobacteriota bacterium]MCA1651145.1 tetratricopeptide repeat protein [Acidobacteriota bacterium]